MRRGMSERDVLAELREDSKFAFLFADQLVPHGTPGGKFKRRTKSATFLSEALEKALRCPICGGLMHSKSMTVDHIERREDGGRNTVENSQLAHPFCNSTVKN
jgi:5-methylcytosine-specific restriction endonuclease McrA